MAGERVSLREYARRKGWNPGYVHKLKVAGRLVMDGDKIDVDASELLLAESADPARAHLARSSAPPAQEPADMAGPAAAGGGAPLSSNATFNRAKTASQVFDAKLRELEYKQKVGQLIDVNEARRLAFTAFRVLRDAVLNVPARVQDSCASMSDAFEIGMLLERELTAALETFSVDRVVSDVDDDDAD